MVTENFKFKYLNLDLEMVYFKQFKLNVYLYRVGVGDISIPVLVSADVLIISLSICLYLLYVDLKGCMLFLIYPGQ